MSEIQRVDTGLLIVRYSQSWRGGDLTYLMAVPPVELAAFKIKGRCYLGEVLGKHSEVVATLDDKTLTVLTDDTEFARKAIDLGVLPDSNQLRDRFIDNACDNDDFDTDLRERLHPDDFATLAELWCLTDVASTPPTTHAPVDGPAREDH